MRRSSILTRETAPDVAAWLEGLGLQRARELVDLPENPALGMTRRAVLPIRHGDVLLGFLWVIVGDRPLTDGERDTIGRGGTEVADNLWGRLREVDEGDEGLHHGPRWSCLGVAVSGLLAQPGWQRGQA